MGQTMQDFTRIYDTYLAGVKSGEFRKVSTLNITGNEIALSSPSGVHNSINMLVFHFQGKVFDIGFIF